MQPIFHWLTLGSYVGVMQTLCFALGVTQILVLLDTNMLISPMQIFALGELPNAKIQVGPNASSFASQWNIGLIVL